MKMSKMGKKVMSAVAAIAMVLSLSSYIQPGMAKAAEEPTVKMLGATLSTDNEKGYQSIRAGIEVSNASSFNRRCELQKNIF